MKLNYRLLLLLPIVLLACKQAIEVTPQAKSEVITQVEPQNNYTTLQTINFITGNFNPASHPEFDLIPGLYTNKSGIYLHKEALASFKEMYEAAKAAGISLIIKSAARNFNYQKSIWEAKWSGARTLSSGINAQTDIKDPADRAKEIMKYSAMPGASRHHWGTDIDLNAFDNAYFSSGEGKVLYDWLLANASKYGYYQVYTPKGSERPSGYEEEKWHWTYKPISKYLTAYAKATMKDSLLSGFSGSETASQLKVTEQYILGIHPSCH